MSLQTVKNTNKDIDRCRMSSTCRAWYQVSKTPCLWRKRTFIFRGYCRSHTERVQKIRECVRTVGSYIREIRLVCPSPNLLTAYNVAQCVRTLFIEVFALKNGRTNLQSFVLKDLDFDETWKGFRSSRDHLIFSITRFLANQRRLKYLDLSNASMPSPFAYRIVEAIVRSKSVETLEHIRFENFFSPMANPEKLTSSIHSMLDTLDQLRRLSLNICYLDDKSLVRLCSNAKHSLQQLDLHISCKNNGSSLDPITSSAWKEALSFCADLTVTLEFDYWPSDPTSFIKPELPLVEFTVKGFLCGHCRTSYTSKITNLMNYLAHYFPSTLNKVSMLLRFGLKPTSPALRLNNIIAFWSKCPKLYRASFACGLLSTCGEPPMSIKTFVVKPSGGLGKSKSIKVKNVNDYNGILYHSFHASDVE